MDTKLAELQATIAAAIRDMTDEEFARHSAGKWSAAEILEHLNLTYVGTIKNFDRCLALGKPRASLDRSRARWRRLVITRLGYFPPGRKSPERAQPRGTPVLQIKSEVLENIVRMEHLIAECEACFGSRKPVADHPILGPLTATEWRKFHLVHGKHHVKQILRLRKTP
jgi:hypothetical protein